MKMSPPLLARATLVLAIAIAVATVFVPRNGFAFEQASPSSEQTRSHSGDAELFTTWLRENGADISKLEIRPVAGQGFGAFATAAIPNTEEMFRLPRKLALTLFSARASELAPILEARPELCTNGGGLALMLHFAHQFYYKGEQSFYWPYFQLLPSMDALRTMPLNYNEAEEKALRLTLEGGDKLDTKRGKLKEWTEMYSKLVAENPEIFGADAAKDGSILAEQAKYALLIVNTRSFGPRMPPPEDSSALVPLADILNHRDGANSLYAVARLTSGKDPDTLTEEQRSEEPKEVMIYRYQSHKDHVPGDELFGTYHNTLDGDNKAAQWTKTSPYGGVKHAMDACDWAMLSNYGFVQSTGARSPGSRTRADAPSSETGAGSIYWPGHQCSQFDTEIDNAGNRFDANSTLGRLRRASLGKIYEQWRPTWTPGYTTMPEPGKDDYPLPSSQTRITIVVVNGLQASAKVAIAAMRAILLEQEDIDAVGGDLEEILLRMKAGEMISARNEIEAYAGLTRTIDSVVSALAERRKGMLEIYDRATNAASTYGGLGASSEENFRNILHLLDGEVGALRWLRAYAELSWAQLLRQVPLRHGVSVYIP